MIFEFANRRFVILLRRRCLSLVPRRRIAAALDSARFFEAFHRLIYQLFHFLFV